MPKKLITLLLYKSKRLTAFSSILVKLTGKSREKLHPKHLVFLEKPWFTESLRKSDLVLDIGCGNGQNTFKAACVCRKIIGLDIRKKPLLIAQREKKRRGVKNVCFQFFDIEKKIFSGKEKYDAILLLDVLEHLEEREKVLANIKKLLKKKGSFFISVPNKDTAWKKNLRRYHLPYFSDPDHKIEYNKQEIYQELGKAGFSVKKIMPVIYDSPWVGFIDLTGGISLKIYKKLTLERIKKVKKLPKETTGFRIIAQKT